MTDLMTLQHELYACLHEGAELNQLKMIETEAVSLETRLFIYQQAYYLRLLDALSANYPVLSILLGEEAFANLAHDYIACYPSTFKSIRWFGHELSRFIQNHFYHDHQLALQELAKFEWLQTCAFDAADDPIVTVNDLSNVPPHEWVHLIFKMHASVHRLDLHWNVVSIWQAVKASEPIPEFKQNDFPIPWIIWREHHQNRFCSLPKEEAQYLDVIMAGDTFADLLTLACEHIPVESAATHVVSLLKGWLDVGLISKISY